ncbi:MAG: hypothetical protein JEZ07_10355 [Phycisphaerae bacterium]|nr:hypothetical protein [Phycisphaerae bacterium]
MKKLLIVIMAFSLFGIGGRTVYAQQADDKDVVWLEFEYKGLSGADGEPTLMSGNYGFGSSGEPDEFIKAVQAKAKGEILLAPYYLVGERKIAALEYEGEEAKAFYFDHNGDGKVVAKDILKPVVKEENSRKETAFYTKDFVTTNSDGAKSAMRYKIYLRNLEKGQMNVTWQSSSYFEAKGEIDGELVIFRLIGSGISGDYGKIGRSRYMIYGSNDQYLGSGYLSSLVSHHDRYYKLKIEGNFGKKDKPRICLTKVTEPLGKLDVKFGNDEKINGKLTYGSITGQKDNNINLRINSEATLPPGKYKLTSGSFTFGKGEDMSWSVSFSKGPDFTIKSKGSTTLEMLKPNLTVSSVDEARRYYSDVKESGSFTKNQKIYLSPIIEDKNGVVYSRFTCKDGTDTRPRLIIKDADGKIVEDKTLEYG